MKTVMSVFLDEMPEQAVSFPLYSTLLSLQGSRSGPAHGATLFYHCDPDEGRASKRIVHACTTGNEAPAITAVDYLGTVVKEDGPDVHYFISK